VSALARVVRSLIRIAGAVIVISGIGVVGLAVALRQPVLTALPYKGVVRADPAALRKHVVFLTTAVRPRSASHPDNLERTATYIAEQFRAATTRTYFQTFEARGRRYSNVVALFGPATSAESILIVGAHYDAFGDTGDLPGADDNASGTAGLLELARLLALSGPKRPVILVAFANEEPPFFGSEQMGSAVHAESLAATTRSVRGMICLEMIGYYDADQSWPNPLFALLYPGAGDFIGVTGGWTDRQLARTVKRAIAGAGGIPVVSYSGFRETSDASDHRNYWARGWHAVMVTDTAYLRNPNYHTRGDVATTLNYKKMARVIDGVFGATLHLSSG
jgi:Zn-dependent M28 family amino/carboxypeptidase